MIECAVEIYSRRGVDEASRRARQRHTQAQRAGGGHRQAMLLQADARTQSEWSVCGRHRSDGRQSQVRGRSGRPEGLCRQEQAGVDRPVRQSHR